MCLIVKNGSAFVAQEDIQTYKVVFVDKRALRTKEKTGWHGLYQFRKHFPFDVVLEETGCDEDDMYKFDPAYNIVNIAGGFFHSTTDIEDAIELAQTRRHCRDYEAFGKSMGIGVICKATIPKGSVYYKGVFRQHRMASTKLIVHHQFLKAETARIQV